jgi:hypothetical protein
VYVSYAHNSGGKENVNTFSIIVIVSIKLNLLVFVCNKGEKNILLCEKISDPFYDKKISIIVTGGCAIPVSTESIVCVIYLLL